jgi:hypothetical protein
MCPGPGQVFMVSITFVTSLVHMSARTKMVLCQFARPKGKIIKPMSIKKGILQRVVLYSTSLICYTQELYFSDPLNQTNVGNRTGGLPFDRTEPITGKNVKQPNPLVAPRGDVTRSRMRCGAVVGERGGGSRRGWGGRSGVVTLRSLGWDGE